ncbi:MAG: HNH endonuclease [Rhodanobacteraceae bacterium]
MSWETAINEYQRSAKASPFHYKKWKRVRYQALVAANGRCQCCGARASDGVQLHVDHIKPKSRYPELEFELSNLQVLCEDCNIGKGADDETDWR